MQLKRTYIIGAVVALLIILFALRDTLAGVAVLLVVFAITALQRSWYWVASAS